MDTESIKAFLEVQRTGSISAAAERHYLTQPALGKRVAVLERELGSALFIRGKGQSRVTLTPAGQAFLDIAERIMLLYEQALELKNETAREYLTVASIRSAHDVIVPNLILNLKRMHPDLSVTVEEHHTAEIIDLLEKRRIDAGIIQEAAASPKLKSELLYRESYNLVVRADSPLAAGTTVTLNDLDAKHAVFQVFDLKFEEWFSKHWPISKVKVKVNTTPTAVQYFSEPMDWMVVPEAVADYLEKQGFVKKSFEEKLPEHCIYLCFNPDNNTAALQWFIESISLSLS